MLIIPTPDLPQDTAGARTGRLLKLVSWLSPAFPVGSFSYSHGLEFAIETGIVTGEAELHAWIRDLIICGSGWTDAVLVALAWRAAASGDTAGLHELADLAGALAPSRERHLETVQQGAAFLEAVTAAWPSRLAGELRGNGEAPYPVAVGAVAAEHGIAIEDLLPAWLNAFATTLISVAVRLVPLGQSAGLRTLAALHPTISETAWGAATATLDDLGSATVLSDIASMRHEQQYSRVFRT